MAGPNGMLLASRDTSAVTAACLLVRADLFDRLGGFDREFNVLCYDADFCLRARALGYKVIQDAYAVLRHTEIEGHEVAHGSPHWADFRRFLSRHGNHVFAGDPFYSPLLSSSSTDMALAALHGAKKRSHPRTTPIVLPGRISGSKSLRVDSAFTLRPIVVHERSTR